MIRVLQVLGKTGLGGAESRIMDIYRHMDRNEVQFDFLIHYREKGYFDEEIQKLGGNIYYLPSFRVYNYFAYKKACREFFREHNTFAAVHGHMTSTAAIYLPEAKRAGIPLTIAHARSAGVDKGIKGTITKFFRRNLYKKCDRMFSCSDLAAKAVFGRKRYEEGKVTILPNAVDTKAFLPDKETRSRIRKQYGVENAFVIGHVGRFHYAKNHTFLLDVFVEIQKRRSDAVLMLLGDGPLKEEMEQKAVEMGVKDKVLFLGNQTPVAPFYQAFDFFLFPSHFEGLPGTVVEAQAAGISCLISDAITGQVKATDLVTFMSLKKNSVEWAEEVLCLLKKRQEGVESTDLSSTNFDVNNQVAFYKTLYSGEKIHIFIARMGIGGSERVCVNLANEFARKGNEVHVIVLNLEKDVNTHLLDESIQVHSLKVSRLRYSPVAMLRYVKKYKPPFLFVFGNEMAVILNKLRKLHFIKTPVIVRVLNNVNISLSKEDNVSPVVENYLKQAQKELLDMEHVIAQCDAMKEMLLKKGLVTKEKLSRIYNPVSRDLIQKTEKIRIPFKQRDEDRKREIVFIGRLDPQKNLPHLIEAFSIVNEECPNTILRLIGDGHLTENIRKLAEEKGLREQVRLEGTCKNMESVYATADMVVLSSEYEGMPNCLIEAIGCGIPIVSYDCPIGPGEIVVDGVNGYLVKYNDILQLAVKMTEGLKHDWDEESIRRTADKFDVSYIADEYLELCEKVTHK